MSFKRFFASNPRPVKSPLKAQNGVKETDSPVKKVVKRSRQLMDSDDDDTPVVKEQAPPKEKALPKEKAPPKDKAPPKEEKVRTHGIADLRLC